MTRRRYVVRNGETVEITNEKAPRAESAGTIVRNFEHVCHSLRDPEIPHTVKYGPNKGKGAFANMREVREFEAKLADRGMGHLKYE